MKNKQYSIDNHKGLKTRKTQALLSLLSISACALGSFGFINPALADNKPQPLSTTQSIEAVNFVDNDIVPVYGKPFFTTLVTFASDEVIQAVTNGDSAAWTVQAVNGKPNMMLIKTNVETSNTNLTVVTNKHTYFFNLHALAKDYKHVPTYAINFSYPQEEADKIKAEKDYTKQQKDAILSAYAAPDKYNWDYTFNGDRSIMPLHVYDDGTFTYFEFRKDTPQPAIFAVDNKAGKEAVVNVRRKGNYVIVQRVSPQFTLRFGKYHVASLFNNPAIAKLDKNS